MFFGAVGRNFNFVQDTMLAYFSGEKTGGLVLGGLGILGLVAAGLFFPERWGLRSFAITLAVFALIEIAIGVVLYVRTDPQVKGLVAQLSSDAAAYAIGEGARMARVQRAFAIALYVEVVVIIVATLMAFTAKQRPTLSGIALGVLLNTALLLTFDIIAERRGAVYLAAIQRTR